MAKVPMLLQQQVNLQKFNGIVHLGHFHVRAGTVNKVKK